MTFALPPIAQLAERLMLDIELAVRRFPRYHRYAAGSDLRAKALAIATLTHRAWRDRPRQREHAWNLVWAIDELKIQLQLCSRLRAFTSLAQFEALFRSARELGKQAGGWYRQLTGQHPKGQDAQGQAPVVQRAQQLSTRLPMGGLQMTNSRYQHGCSSGSQVCGDASPAAYAWIVSFNNGNANNNHRDNNNRVRAVRGPARELQGDEHQVSFTDLHAAWKAARRSKKPSANRLAFDARWADRLIELQEQLNAGTWQPQPSTCFIATRPKAREIHAPDFGDRVVHHWLVPQIEAIYEPAFIHDSFANRRGKGSHAAVRRLQQFVREVHSGQGGGWFLQLDVANFFNRIHRPTLYALLKTRTTREGLSLAAQRTMHALLRSSIDRTGVNYRTTPERRALVPLHKQLQNAPTGCGIPIGNLSSQFFANVYLDQLDQFVKHTLKAKRYLRYVDDFVIVHHDRAQLECWRVQIEQFLQQSLRLELKADQRLAPLATGIDFLGYIVRPTHTTVRRRIVSHAREALAKWETTHVRGRRILATPDGLRAVRAVWASYQGHFTHADSHRLRQTLLRRFRWLPAATAKRRFPAAMEGRVVRLRCQATL
jgi:retron-type reverse transcriptase